MRIRRVKGTLKDVTYFYGWIAGCEDLNMAGFTKESVKALCKGCRVCDMNPKRCRIIVGGSK